MSVFRYSSKGISDQALVRTVPGTPVVTSYAPAAFVDVTAPLASQADLDEVMSRYGFILETVDPTVASPLTGYRQSVFTRVTVDTTTIVVSPVFATLLSAPITLSTSAVLLVFVSFAASRSNPALDLFQVKVDGVVQAGGGAAVHGHGGGVSNSSGAIVLRIAGLAAGPHTIAVEWSQDAAGTVSIRPVTAPDAEHASLLLVETGS